MFFSSLCQVVLPKPTVLQKLGFGSHVHSLLWWPFFVCLFVKLVSSFTRVSMLKTEIIAYSFFCLWGLFVSPDVVLWAISGSSEVFQHVHFMIRIL